MVARVVKSSDHEVSPLFEKTLNHKMGVYVVKESLEIQCSLAPRSDELF